jgi:hypothetical protein
VYNHRARGALLTVVIGDGSGYAATSDLSSELGRTCATN